jgi:hypothetical protein
MDIFNFRFELFHESQRLRLIFVHRSLSKVNFYDKNALNFKYKETFFNLSQASVETSKINDAIVLTW